MNFRIIEIISLLLFLININSNNVSAHTSYTNPVMGNGPDPTVLYYKGKFFLYPTFPGSGMPVYESDNLANWQRKGRAFTTAAPKLLPDGGSLWAPDVIEYKGKILMAYASAKIGEFVNNGIGIAIADNPLGPFTDSGMLFTSKEIGVKNSIDPSFYIKGKTLYLLWGSFHGIYITQLNTTDLDHISVKSPVKKTQLAGNIFEGTHIYKRGKYFYMFASIGKCCAGLKSTYQVVVGRSKNLMGPYVNKHGEYMLDNAYTPLIKGTDDFVGPGHGSSILLDNEGKTWYVYHSYVKNDMAKGRQVMLQEIKWDKEGWPYVEKGIPCKEAPAPVFK